MKNQQPCKCSERRIPIVFRRWGVHLRQKRLANSRLGWKLSPKSTVHCFECGAVWRTKAKYVKDLRDFYFKTEIKDGELVQVPIFKSKRLDR